MAQSQQTVWAWLWTGAVLPAPQAPAVALDDDLDFLQAPEPVEQQIQPLLAMDRSAVRWAEATAWLATEPGLPADWPTHARDARWPHVDAPAAWLACQWWLQVADPLTVRGAAHGPVSELLRRAVRCADAELALCAAQTIAHLRVEEAQEDVALRLMEPASLDHLQQSALLDVLDGLGDGRCVRAMEAMLAAVGPQLPDHHAWRARHIVQRIRRGGRR